MLIALADVLLLMDTTADPFTVVYVTADRQRGIGGEPVRLEGCVATSTNKERAAAAAPSAPAAEYLHWTETARFKPAHRINQTRNVTILSSGHTRKLHVRLIVEFNDQTVHW